MTQTVIGIPAINVALQFRPIISIILQKTIIISLGKVAKQTRERRRRRRRQIQQSPVIKPNSAYRDDATFSASI